ncbi:MULTISPECIES: type I restriction endonuclease subunit R [unclassified Cyanobium]|uniref:type I restriction endonuclease subunit R n=1 Tax=unclassified Cyanobium TaxID=2627006 RepID=UPI0020CBE4E9|nr:MULTISPECIES: type I restriction endonuclease [unclassified Cyanobium]MCP9860612.1 type I restriction endonuclease subunit R [Cyanobium sp. Cruz-8H5]MCP9867849.1 type I restriction endonuclease subunit R [Cyanobium sp. Cruz-8D1]
MPTNTSEQGLEALITRAMTGRTYLLEPPHQATSSSVPVSGGTGWLLGDPRHYDRSHCVDLMQLQGFLEATQPQIAEAVAIGVDGPTRRQFLARVEKQIAQRGVVDVLRKGIRHGPHEIQLFYGTPSPGNSRAAELFARNRFSLCRQLAYSNDQTRRALDLALFVNGLPVATFELKNNLTCQDVQHAIRQYQRDRDPREPLFALARCLVHFAVDEQEVQFCTHLQGKDSDFLPFNRGTVSGGSGNPPNPDGLATAYLWDQILTPSSLTDILENYAQVIEKRNPRTGRKTHRQIFPRYHQLDVVCSLLADVAAHGAGRCYLGQHSAGSGKSNSIAWLSHQVGDIIHNGERVFDSVIVVTDRRNLDEQLRNNILDFMQVGATVGAVTGRGSTKTEQLKQFLAAGKKIIICTLQTFPELCRELDEAPQGRRYAVIIDEAHCSQGSKASAALNQALAADGALPEDIDVEDFINTAIEDFVNTVIEQRLQSRGLRPNASYFAFTATAKAKTRELFGTPLPPNGESKIGRRPFHAYTMKQAIEEKFILNVLQYYIPISSYYRLVKTIEADPLFDSKRARSKLRRYVESHDTAIRNKAEIMVDHFLDAVLPLREMKGEARAMVVTGAIERAVQYFHAIRRYLLERRSPYLPIVAFSGEHDFGDGPVSEACLNGFPSSEITSRIQEDPYRFLICADKFQTGYDEPLLQSMYVDKALGGIQAVQTLSRLNRAAPGKKRVFILDFQDNAAAVEAAFADYYKTTLLSEATDPNKLHDLRDSLDQLRVYTWEQVEEFVALFLSNSDRDALQPILNQCRYIYNEQLNEDDQVAFKSKAKAFVRSYDFLATILTYGNPEWEKLSIFLTLLVRALPAPDEDDLTTGMLELIDMDSYRIDKQNQQRIALPDDDATLDPAPVSGGGFKTPPELDPLSVILTSFNDQYGTSFSDEDRIRRLIRDEIVPQVAQDQRYRNAKANTPNTAAIELDAALNRAVDPLFLDQTEFYKQFKDNSLFRNFVRDLVTRLINDNSGKSP